MIELAIPAFGFLFAVAGGLFLVGCFVRVDSPGFIERAAGDEQKIHKLRSLQVACKNGVRFTYPGSIVFVQVAYLVRDLETQGPPPRRSRELRRTHPARLATVTTLS